MVQQSVVAADEVFVGMKGKAAVGHARSSNGTEAVKTKLVVASVVFVNLELLETKLVKVKNSFKLFDDVKKLAKVANVECPESSGEGGHSRHKRQC